MAKAREAKQDGVLTSGQLHGIEPRSRRRVVKEAKSGLSDTPKAGIEEDSRVPGSRVLAVGVRFTEMGNTGGETHFSFLFLVKNQL